MRSQKGNRPWSLRVRKISPAAGLCGESDVAAQMGGQHFANLFGNTEFNNVKANLFLDKAVFENDLSSISVNARVKAQSEAVATFDLRPVNAGYFFCPPPFGGQVRFDVSIPIQPLALSATTDWHKTRNWGIDSYA